MTRVKGSNICYARTYAESRDSERGFSAVLERLSPEDRVAIPAVIPSGWYDLTLQHRVFAALDEAFAMPGADPVEGLARFIAEQDLTRVHRLFLRFRNPAVVLEKAGEYWNRFYDAGEWKVERVSATRARGELSNIADTHPVFCRFLVGYTERMFQLAGAHVGDARHTACVLNGAPACVFEGRWQEKRVAPDPARSSPPPTR